jgi:hypothetical protein
VASARARRENGHDFLSRWTDLASSAHKLARQLELPLFAEQVVPHPAVAVASGYRRPQRPTRGRPDPIFCQLLKERCAIRDTQRKRVYAWEREVLGRLQDEPLLGQLPGMRRLSRQRARQAGLDYLNHLWRTYAPNFTPYYEGLPYLRIGFATGVRRGWGRRRTLYGAHAVPARHQIYCRIRSLRRATLVHEVCHLLAWGDGHGAAFCAALLVLWEREFGIEPEMGLRLAARMQVKVTTAPPKLQ